MCTIYKITNLINSKVYIGQTWKVDGCSNVTVINIVSRFKDNFNDSLVIKRNLIKNLTRFGD